MASAKEKVLSPSYIGDGKTTTRAIGRWFSGLIYQAAEEPSAEIRLNRGKSAFKTAETAPKRGILGLPN